MSPTARLGRDVGYPVAPYVLVRTLQHRAAANRRLSAIELGTLRLLAGNSDEFIRTRALTAAANLTDDREAGLAMARNAVPDRSWLVRLYALRALELLNAPDLMVYAKRMSSDPNQDVYERARRIVRGQPPPTKIFMDFRGFAMDKPSR